MTALLARIGVLRLIRAERSFIAGLPPREYAEMRAYLARPQGWTARRRRAACLGAVPGPGQRLRAVAVVTGCEC